MKKCFTTLNYLIIKDTRTAPEMQKKIRRKSLNYCGYW